MENPFNLIFGKSNETIIDRNDIINLIFDTFEKKNPDTQVYILTGVRGSGKTVLLTDLYKKFQANSDYVVVDVNPHRNIWEDIASFLYEQCSIRKMFTKATFGLSFHGINFSIEGKEPAGSIIVVVEKMLSYLKRHDVKLVITLDEVASSKEVKEFVHDFQSLVRKDFSIFLIMTGLYDNVSSLQNNKMLTFLYRAPKILLKPLDLVSIKNNYMHYLKDISESDAIELTKLSNGYGFAYQALGYLYFNIKAINTELLTSFDNLLSENVYNKVWSDLSKTEKKILESITNNNTNLVKDILVINNLNNSTFSVHRDRLLKKGLILCPEYGVVKLALPRFDIFIKNLSLFE